MRPPNCVFEYANMRICTKIIQCHLLIHHTLLSVEYAVITILCIVKLPEINLNIQIHAQTHVHRYTKKTSSDMNVCAIARNRAGWLPFSSPFFRLLSR